MIKKINYLKSVLLMFFVSCIVTWITVVSAFCAHVPEDIARRVAENYIQQVLAVFGVWANSKDPEITRCQLIEYKDILVAYNFEVHPRGHLLIPSSNELSPVLLFSTTSAFVTDSPYEKGDLASWIVPEIYKTMEILRQNEAVQSGAIVYEGTRVAKAWEWLQQPEAVLLSEAEGSTIEFTVKGPILKTAWDQGWPYNWYMPGWCVDYDQPAWTGGKPTALGQIMRYWKWPDYGTGQHTYTWKGKILGADFEHLYHWNVMSTTITTYSPFRTIRAVAGLIYDIGVAMETDYGCEMSGTDPGSEVSILPKNFQYKSTLQFHSREGMTSNQWFDFLKSEFEALRPVLLSIYAADTADHSMVSDGYLIGDTDKVHINFGWSEKYRGYYDITHNFTTGTLTWEADKQFILNHILPIKAREPKWVFQTSSYSCSSPAIAADGTIYVGSWDDNLYAVNPDGTEKWAFKTGRVVNSSPAIAADGTIYVGSRNSNLYAVNPDGTEKWAFKTREDVDSSPAIAADGTIYVGSRDNNLYAVNPDGTEKWVFETGGDVASSPAIAADGTIYVGSWDVNLYAVNPDGTEKWAFKTGSGVCSSPAIAADGTIYVGSWDDNLYAVNPDGTEKWAFKTRDSIDDSSPAIAADGTIYVGSLDDNLYAVNPDGTLEWFFRAGGDMNSSPAIAADGTIYVGSWDGNLYAILDDSGGLADSKWPMFRHDPRHTGAETSGNTD